MVDNENAEFDYEQPIGKMTSFVFDWGLISSSDDWREVINVMTILLW